MASSENIFDLNATVEVNVTKARKGLVALTDIAQGLANTLKSIEDSGFNAKNIVAASKAISREQQRVAAEKEKLDQADFSRLFKKMQAGENLSRGEMAIIKERMRLETEATRQENTRYAALQKEKLANYRSAVIARENIEKASIKNSQATQKARDAERRIEIKKLADFEERTYKNSIEGIIAAEDAKRAASARKAKILGQAGLGQSGRMAGPALPPSGPAGPNFAKQFAQGAASALAFGGAVGAGMAAVNALQQAVTAFFREFYQGISKAIKLSFEFENSIKQLQAVTKIDGAGLEKLSEDLRTVGDRLKIGVDPEEAVQGLKDLFALGYTDVPKAMKVLETSLKLSKAGFIDQGKAAELLGTTMIAYGADASEAARFSDALIKSTDLGAVTMEQLAQSMGRVTPFAVQAGVSIEELTGLIGVSTATGLRAESSITGFGQAFQKLNNPGDKATKTLEKYGLVVNAATIKQNGFIETIKEIDRTIKGDSAAWQDILGGNTRAQVSITSLFTADEGEARYARLDEGLKAVEDAAGLTEERITKIMESANEQFKLLQSNIKSAAIAFGKSLEPAIAKFLSILNGELKPFIDEIVATLSVMSQEFFRLFAIDDTAGMGQMLKDINIGLLETMKVVTYLIGIIKTFNAVLKILQNVIALTSGMIFRVQKLISEIVSNPFKTTSLLEEFKNGIEEDVNDIKEGWSNLLNVDSEWEAALARQEKLLKAAREKFVKIATPIDFIGEGIQGIAGAPNKAIQSIFGDKGIASQLKNSPKGFLKNQVGKEKGKPVKGNPLNPLAGFGAIFEGVKGVVRDKLYPKEGPPVSTSKPTRDIAAETESISRRLELEKISGSEAVALYEGVLRAAKSQLATAEDREKATDQIFKLEKAIKEIIKDQKKEQEDKDKNAKKELEDRIKLNQQLSLKTTKETKGETQADKEALNNEVEDLKKQGADPDTIKAYYASESARISREDKERTDKESKKKLEESNKKDEEKFKLEADLYNSSGKGSDVLKARFAELDAEFAKFKGTEENKTLIAETYAKKRAEIEKKYLQEVEDARLSLAAKTVENQAAVLEASGKTAQAEKIVQDQKNAEKFAEIKKTVEQAKRDGVSEVDIRKYVASEQVRILKEQKQEEQQIEQQAAASKSISGVAADPRMAFEDAFEGIQTGLTFGIATGGSRKKGGLKKKGNSGASALAASLNGLLEPASSNLNSSLSKSRRATINNKTPEGEFRNTLDLNLNINGIPQQSVALSGGSPKQISSNLGRFPV